MEKVFYKGKEIDLPDLRIEWDDNFGHHCTGDLFDYRASEVNDALSEYAACEGW